jgi:hypothetical protein
MWFADQRLREPLPAHNEWPERNKIKTGRITGQLALGDSNRLNQKTGVMLAS